MCGIAGFFNPSADYTKEKNYRNHILEMMNQVQKHRGPDDEGTFLSPQCGLAHVRLNIIDLVTGHQQYHFSRRYLPLTPRQGRFVHNFQA